MFVLCNNVAYMYANEPRSPWSRLAPFCHACIAASGKEGCFSLLEDGLWLPEMEGLDILNLQFIMFEFFLSNENTFYFRSRSIFTSLRLTMKAQASPCDSVWPMSQHAGLCLGVFKDRNHLYRSTFLCGMFNSDREIFCGSYIQSLPRTGIQAISLPRDLVRKKTGTKSSPTSSIGKADTACSSQ